MPALSTLDTFTDSNMALASHTPDFRDYSWTTHASWGVAASLYGNRAVPGNGESVAYLSLAVPSRASENWGVEAPVYYAGTQASSYGGLFAGVTGAKTGYVVYWYGGTWALGKYVAGTWTALGTYSESFSTGTSKTVRMRFTSTQVIVSIDGTDRITVTDSSITPTRIGVYGSRATTTAGNTAFHLSDISMVGRAYLNPAVESNTAVGIVAHSIACDDFGVVTAKVGGLAGTPTVERSADNSTWSDISSEAYVSRTGSGPHTVVDLRPQYGGGAVPLGDTVYYRFSNGGKIALAAVVSDVDEDAVIRLQAEAAHDYISAKTGGYVPTSEDLQPGEWMLFAAYAYWRGTRDGWPGLAGYLDDCQNQWDYVKTLDSGGLLYDSSFVNSYYTDFCLRPVMHALECARLLRRTGDVDAVALADDIVSQCETWCKNTIDLLGTSSKTYAGWDADNQPAIQRSTDYEVGDLVRPVTPNGHSFRCKVAGTTASGAVSLSTTAEAETTDGTVVWKETSRTRTRFAYRYLTGTYGAVDWLYVANKELVTLGALSLMMLEQGTDFAIGGSYHATALGIVEDVAETFCSCFMNADGSMPYTESTSPDPTLAAKDTLYGGFCSSTLAISYHVGWTRNNWQVWPTLNQILDWVEGGTYSTEPLTALHHGGDTYVSPGGDISLRKAAYGVTERTHPVLRLIFTAAMLDVATGLPGYYDVNGDVTSYEDQYGDGRYNGDIFDGLALDASIIATTFVTLTPAEEADSAPALSVAKRVTLTPATETDVAVALTQPHSVSLTPATETDTAVALSITSGPTAHFVTLTPATETDSAQALTVTQQQRFTLTPATETDVAVTLSVGSGTHHLDLTPATETDVVVALTKVKSVTVTPSTEVDVAITLTKKKSATLSPASEADSATSLSYTGYVSPSTRPRILLDTYVISAQFGSKTVSSDMFGSRTSDTAIHSTEVQVHTETSIS